MTTNEPKVQQYGPISYGGRSAWMQEDDFGGWVRAVNYEVLQSELSNLQAECEKLRNDAEFGRSVLAKREPGKSYGCHCDLDEGVEPDGCVIDLGERHNCIYADHITVKEECEYWRVIATDRDTKHDNQPVPEKTRYLCGQRVIVDGDTLATFLHYEDEDKVIERVFVVFSDGTRQWRSPHNVKSLPDRQL